MKARGIPGRLAINVGVARTEDHALAPELSVRSGGAPEPDPWHRPIGALRLAEADIEAIATLAAVRVLELLERRGAGTFKLLEPKELASALNVSLDYVYAHAADLGVMRLGD